MNMMQMFQMIGSLKNNPMAMLSQRGLNVPDGMGNNPQQIVNHLIQSGQVSQNTLNQAMQTASQMGIKLQ